MIKRLGQAIPLLSLAVILSLHFELHPIRNEAPDVDEHKADGPAGELRLSPIATTQAQRRDWAKACRAICLDWPSRRVQKRWRFWRQQPRSSTRHMALAAIAIALAGLAAK